jgi:hypothetical protein
MKFLRLLQYLGITSLMAGSVGLIFAVVFIVLLSMSMAQALFVLSFFGSIGTVGFVIVNSPVLREKYGGDVLDEPI